MAHLQSGGDQNPMLLHAPDTESAALKEVHGVVHSFKAEAEVVRALVRASEAWARYQHRGG